MTSAFCVQVAFRGRDDTQTLNSSTFNYNQNTDWSQDVDTTFRVRLEIEEQNNKLFTVGGQLEARLYTTSWGSWFDVTTTSTILKAVVSGQFNEGDATTNILTVSARTFVTGQGVEDGLASSVNINYEHTEHEYALQIISGDVENGNLIEVREKGLDDWTAVPQITVVESVATPTSGSTFSYTKGQIVDFRGAPTPQIAYAGGQDSASDFTPAYGEAIGYGLDATDAYASGLSTADDFTYAYSDALAGALDHTDAFAYGLGTADDFTYAYTRGSASDLDHADAFLSGVAGANDHTDAFTHGLDSDLDYTNAYTQGQTSDLDDTLAYLIGAELTSGSVPAFTLGLEPIANSIDAFTQGLDTDLDSTSANLTGQDFSDSAIFSYTSGVAGASDDTSAYAQGYAAVETSGSSFLNSFTIGVVNWVIPVSDVADTGEWLNELGQNTNLYQSIDEYPTPSDLDYIVNANPISSNYYECMLNDISGSPGDGDVVVLWRGCNTSGSGGITAKLELRQGASIIASMQQLLPTDITTYYFTLTPAERANITDWSDLRIRIIVV